MKEFKYYSPKSLNEIFKIFEAEKGETCLIAGGTDVMLEINSKKVNPDVVINLKSIDEINYIKEDNEFIRIGAGTTFTKLSSDAVILNSARALAQACSKVGSTQIRNLGTIGGNIVTGSACGDSVSALVALDAILVIQSPKGKREITLTDFYSPGQKSVCDGCYHNTPGIGKDEVLVEVYFKKAEKNEFSAFRKLGKRKALAKSILTVGMSIEFDDDKKVKNARISLGAVGKHPYRVTSAENIIDGKKLSDETIEDCLNEISNIVIANIGSRASCPFKKESVKGVAREVFASIIEQSSL